MSNAPDDTPQPPARVTASPMDYLRLAAAMSLPRLVVLAVLGMAGWFVHAQGDKIAAGVVASLDRAATARTDRLHSTALDDAVLRNRSLAAILIGLRDSQQAARSSLWQFHNGTSTLAGIPFLKVSQTNVEVAPGIASLQDRHQGLPLAIIIDWIPRFLNRECVDQDDDNASASLQQLMKEGGIDRLLACPVFIPGLREPAGYLVLTYSRGWTVPDREAAFASLRASAVATGAVLSAFRESGR